MTCRCAHEGASGKDLRIAALCSLGFAGLFSFNDLSNIQRNHIAFHDEFVKIFELRSKTDVYIEKVILFMYLKLIPITVQSILDRYIKAVNISPSCSQPIFRPLIKKKSGYSLRNGKLSYDRCRGEIFKGALKN